MTLVVGVLGFKGSGKDTVGDYLVREHGFVRDSFANPLKDAVAATFGWDREMLEGATKESREWREQPDHWWQAKLDWDNHPARHLSEFFTPRVALQFFGTEVFREHFHNDIWILSLQNRLRGKTRVVITDCRFPNEFKVIQELKGIALRVRRGPEPSWIDIAHHANSGLVGSKAAQIRLDREGVHISESAWLSLPFPIIENDGSIADLEHKVSCLIQSKIS
jgi:hypothetical protein